MFYMYHQFEANVGKYSISSWWFSSHFKHMLVKLEHSQVGMNISIFEGSHRLVFLWGKTKDNRPAALVFLCMACAPEV